MKRMAAVVLVLGCGPQVDAGGDATSGGTTGRDPTTGVDPTFDPATTTSTATSSTTTATTTGLETTSDADESTTSCWNFPDAGGGAFECSVWEENCPCGYKCMPYANDGGGSWNALRCTPVADDPHAPGEPCTVEGDGVSGIDDCELHAMCWDVDPDTNMGTCRAFCSGASEAEGFCPEPHEWCYINSDGLTPLCLPCCSPLLQDCATGDACSSFEDSAFRCVPLYSELPAGEPCEYANVCAAGLACSPGVPGCAAETCCAAYCDVQAEDPCPGAPAQVECIPPPPADHPCHDPAVGICRLP